MRGVVRSGAADYSGCVMRLRLLHRTFAAVCGLWLALSLAEPASLHVCAMHGSQGATHSHGAASATHGGSHGTHSSNEHDNKAPCTCLGGCCMAVAVASVLTPPLVLTVVTAPLPHILVPAAISYRPEAVAYARPPTVGPPLHTA